MIIIGRTSCKLARALKMLRIDLEERGLGIVDGIEFAYKLSTDSKFRDEMYDAFATAASDPMEFAKSIAKDYLDKGTEIKNWTKKGQYELGNVTGELIGGVITGGAAVKLIKYAKNFKKIQKKQKFLKRMAKARKFESAVLNKALKSGRYSKFKKQVSFRTKDGTLARFDGVGYNNKTKKFEIIEAKMGGGKLTKNQRKVLNALNKGEKVSAVGKNATAIFGKSNIGTSKSVNSLISKSVNLNNSINKVGKVLKTR